VFVDLPLEGLALFETSDGDVKGEDAETHLPKECLRMEQDELVGTWNVDVE
jgi:hypothetical protein